MSHLTCTNCGQKSPFEATKCKHCGRPFGRPPARPGDRRATRWIPTLVLLTAAGLILVGAWQWWPAFRPVRPSTPPESTAAAVVEPSPPARESLPAAVPPARRPARDSTPRVAAAAAAAKDSAPSPPPPARPAPASIDPAHQRYAREWVKLRSQPGRESEVLRVLQPGEVVTIDSLQDGWYRVVIDSGAVGFVDGEYLDTLPPSNR